MIYFDLKKGARTIGYPSPAAGEETGIDVRAGSLPDHGKRTRGSAGTIRPRPTQRATHFLIRERVPLADE